jgi:hypothetical protein
VHALVDGVLLRPAGLDELGIEAELEEPDGEGGEPGQGAGGEGRAVVGSDAVGDPVGLKEPPEVLDGSLKGGGRVSADANNVTGGQIGDRQGEAVLPVLEAEPPL